MTHFVVVQSVKDFNKERKERDLLFLRSIGWFAASYFIAAPLNKIAPVWFIITFLLSVSIFMMPELTRNRKFSSKIRAFLVIPTGLWGFGYLWSGILFLQWQSILIGILFLVVAIHYLRKYTNIVRRLTIHKKYIK